MRFRTAVVKAVRYRKNEASSTNTKITGNKHFENLIQGFSKVVLIAIKKIR